MHPLSPRFWTALLTLSLLLLAGCGGDGDTTIVNAGTTTETTTETTTTSGAGEDGSPPPADTVVTELTGFSSPSGNIGCYIDRASVRCDIGERDWKPPPPPPDCKLDYGQGLVLPAGGTADLVCAGDTALNGDSGTTLPYGQSIAAGLLRCESEQAGISCRDIETGRGFFLSRESYELF